MVVLEYTKEILGVDNAHCTRGRTNTPAGHTVPGSSLVLAAAWDWFMEPLGLVHGASGTGSWSLDTSAVSLDTSAVSLDTSAVSCKADTAMA